MEHFVESALYVSTAPFFWQAMGITSTVGMFIGALLYNGNIRLLGRAMINMFVYVCLITLTNVTRLSSLYNGSDIHPALTYAPTLTIFWVSIFYVLGLVIGSVVVRLVRSKNEGLPN